MEKTYNKEAMLNCRSIPEEVWQRAWKLLFFYFSRRGRPDAEDLVQRTFLAMIRSSFEFEKEEDFLKVCFGFARNILHEGRRESVRHLAGELDFDMAAPDSDAGGARATEARIFLAEVQNLIDTRLSEMEWELISQALEENSVGREPPGVKSRVGLHRARQKLKKLAGWLLK
jgi:DNA-directed RNA polymerase specialized sigma24 family protein